MTYASDKRLKNSHPMVNGVCHFCKAFGGHFDHCRWKIISGNFDRVWSVENVANSPAAMRLMKGILLNGPMVSRSTLAPWLVDLGFINQKKTRWGLTDAGRAWLEIV